MPPRPLHPPLLPLLRHPTPLLRHPTPFHPLLAPHILTRPATHASEARANGPKNGAGRRLGAKKGSTELVVPGNIIFRQRGTLWFPGENCGMGRDHTIFAREKGYVTYYTDEDRFPGRKYIGVVFERGETLPRGRNSARRRRLGLVSRPRVVRDSGEAIVAEATTIAPAPAPAPEASTTPAPKTPPTPTPSPSPSPVSAISLTRKGYAYRESNWSIGRTAERAALARPPLTRAERAQRVAVRKAAKMEALLLMGRKKGKAKAKAKGKGKRGAKGRGR